MKHAKKSPRFNEKDYPISYIPPFRAISVHRVSECVSSMEKMAFTMREQISKSLSRNQNEMPVMNETADLLEYIFSVWGGRR